MIISFHAVEGLRDDLVVLDHSHVCLGDGHVEPLVIFGRVGQWVVDHHRLRACRVDLGSLGCGEQVQLHSMGPLNHKLRAHTLNSAAHLFAVEELNHGDNRVDDDFNAGAVIHHDVLYFACDDKSGVSALQDVEAVAGCGIIPLELDDLFAVVFDVPRIVLLFLLGLFLHLLLGGGGSLFLKGLLGLEGRGRVLFVSVLLNMD
jgi:hypothetical protein